VPNSKSEIRISKSKTILLNIEIRNELRNRIAMLEFSIRERENQACAADSYLELSMICCAFLIADSSGALSFFRMSIAFCAEALASLLLPSLA